MNMCRKRSEVPPKKNGKVRGNDFHLMKNKEKMKNGKSLNDNDRFQWLHTIKYVIGINYLNHYDIPRRPRIRRRRIRPARIVTNDDNSLSVIGTAIGSISENIVENINNFDDN